MLLDGLVWRTVLEFDVTGQRIHRPQGFESPYLWMPEILEGERGAELSECIFCRCVREDVRDYLVEFEAGQMVPCDVCRACRARGET